MNISKNYKLVSEIISTNVDNPNVDMIIKKQYLYHYVPKGRLLNLYKRKGGIDDVTGNGIPSFFCRIPETDKHLDFLSNHVVLKISPSKIIKAKDDAVIIGVNIKGKSGQPLTRDDLIKLTDMEHIFFKKFEEADNIYDVPHALIKFKSNFLPEFTYKVLDKDPTINMNESLTIFNNHYQLVDDIVLYESTSNIILKIFKDILNSFSKKKDVSNETKKIILNNSDIIIKQLNNTNRSNYINKLSKMASRINSNLSKNKSLCDSVAVTSVILSIKNNTKPETELLKLIHKLSNDHLDYNSVISITLLGAASNVLINSSDNELIILSKFLALSLLNSRGT